MRFRDIVLIALIGLAVSACNFTLAADITPPPDYVPPAPQPTLGALFPADPPDVHNGASIYVEDCQPCHGEIGLGDGPQGQQLPVPVAALGLPEIARKASPARWFTVVTQGNLDRFMPPFVSLSDQERWDVVAYALSLHATPEQIELGRDLFESNCGNCATDFFRDQEQMSALSEDDLVNLIKNGSEGIPAFGANLSEDGLYAVAAYLRTLSYGLPPSQVEETPLPSAGETTPQADASNGVPGTGIVIGSLENKSGAPLPAGLTVKLRVFDHATDTSGPQETLSVDGLVQEDGTFVFENVELPEGRILLVDVVHEGVTYQSEFSIVEADTARVQLEPLAIYESTTDFSSLSFEQVHIAFDFASPDVLQVFEIYTFRNETDRAVLIETDGSSVPFITLPEGAQDAGFEAGQDTNLFVGAQGGFAILPSEESYSLIAFFTIPYDPQRTEFRQPLPVRTASTLLFLPEGIRLQSAQLTESGVQQISNTNFITYSAPELPAGEVLTFVLTGRPAGGDPSNLIGTNQTLILGAGALGLALILLGVWMYVHDRFQPKEFDGQGQPEDAEDVMDSIIALDDLHRAGKIPDQAYRARRSELKEKLKRQ
jgi:mono/diheme cytochrome c family protein